MVTSILFFIFSNQHQEIDVTSFTILDFVADQEVFGMKTKLNWQVLTVTNKKSLSTCIRSKSVRYVRIVQLSDDFLPVKFFCIYYRKNIQIVGRHLRAT